MSGDVGADVAAVLSDHREDALTCYDHMDGWCCVCGEHEVQVSWRLHVADALAPLIAEILNDEITGLYHPEFGTEWREDGSLFKIVHEAQAAALREAADDWDEWPHPGTIRDRIDWAVARLRDRADALDPKEVT